MGTQWDCLSVVAQSARVSAAPPRAMPSSPPSPVGVGAVKSKELGMQLMTAIFCHNVAEGFVIAIPVLAGTGNRRCVQWRHVGGVAQSRTDSLLG